MAGDDGNGMPAAAAAAAPAVPAPAVTSRSPSPADDGKTENGPKAKRRKVSRACVYCRRSHMTCDNNRPCMRCIKRDIGHWCRDEPREPSKRKSSAFSDNNGHVGPDMQAPIGSPGDGQDIIVQGSTKDASTPERPKSNHVPGIKAPIPLGTQPATTTMQDWIPALQNQFHDMHSLHPSFLFNAPEVVNEYALLNDFLNPASLEEESGMFPAVEPEAMFNSSLFSAGNATSNMPGQQQTTQVQSALMPPPSAADGNSITRPASTAPNDKSKATYYLTAADPAGNDKPDIRINELLQAKFKAGLLKPFNYIAGYVRFGQYMEKHMQAQNRQKILRQLDKYRPKFRVRMEQLSDVDLIRVEMWFERCLMEYDRIFASMAIPACCWRRTGEIYRGNKELAELINVPVEKLRDGKLALYDIMGEDDLANYWELFGLISFDQEKKGMLTRCSLKSPEQHAREAGIACCFSFTIRRDEHEIPSLIVGNFIPIKPR